MKNKKPTINKSEQGQVKEPTNEELFAYIESNNIPDHILRILRAKGMLETSFTARVRQNVILKDQGKQNNEFEGKPNKSNPKPKRWGFGNLRR